MGLRIDQLEKALAEGVAGRQAIKQFKCVEK